MTRFISPRFSTRMSLEASLVAVVFAFPLQLAASAEPDSNEIIVETQLDKVGGAVVAPSGNHVAFISESNEGNVWIADLRNGVQRELSTKEEGIRCVTALAISPDNKLIAATIASAYDSKEPDQENPAVWVWELDSGRCVAILDMVDDEEAKVVSFSADSRWLMGASGYGKAYVWEVERICRGEKQPRKEVGSRGSDVSISNAAVSHDGRFVVLKGRLGSKTAIGYSESVLQVWNLHTGSEESFLLYDEHANPIDWLVCSPVKNELALVFRTEAPNNAFQLRNTRDLSIVDDLGEFIGDRPVFSTDGMLLASERRRPLNVATVFVRRRDQKKHIREFECQRHSALDKRFHSPNELIILDSPSKKSLRIRRVNIDSVVERRN